MYGCLCVESGKRITLAVRLGTVNHEVFFRCMATSTAFCGPQIGIYGADNPVSQVLNTLLISQIRNLSRIAYFLK